MKLILLRLLFPVFYLTGKYALKTGYKVKKIMFIIGTGRSGSSLLRQILKTNKTLNVFPGEANQLWHPEFNLNRQPSDVPYYIEDPSFFTKKSYETWKPEHSKKIYYTLCGYNYLAGKKNILVLKSAMLSHMIEIINNIFPDALFLHIYRNGFAVISSLMIKEYPKYSFEDKNTFIKKCARYWNECIMEVERVKTTDVKSKIIEISYEELIKNPGTILQKISSFIDCKSDKYSFDLSKLKDMNKKTSGKEKEWNHLQSFIIEGMKLKKYI